MESDINENSKPAHHYVKSDQHRECVKSSEKYPHVHDFS